MATPFYETMENQISAETAFSYGYRNLHSTIKMKNYQDGNIIVVPHESITSKYRSYLQKYIKEIALDDQQYQHFRCNPQAFSEFVYGTTQYWALILELNNCPSRIYFNIKKIKYYDELQLTSVLNEILLKETE